MQEAVMVAPTVIHKPMIEQDKLGIVDIPNPGGERALLVFSNPEQVEEFRAKTGDYPESEGFEVAAVGLDGLRAIIEVWGFEHVALRGPEPDTVSHFQADTFLWILQLSERGE